MVTLEQLTEVIYDCLEDENLHTITDGIELEFYQGADIFLEQGLMLHTKGNRSFYPFGEYADNVKDIFLYGEDILHNLAVEMLTEINNNS